MAKCLARVKRGSKVCFCGKKTIKASDLCQRHERRLQGTFIQVNLE